MRILFLSDSGLSLGLAMRCSGEGHDVRYHCLAGYGQGLTTPFERSENWQPDAFIFDSLKFSKEADAARSAGHKVLGPSQWTSTLMTNQQYSNQIITSVGWQLNGITKGTHFYVSGWFNGVNFLNSYTSIVYRRFMSGGLGPDLECTGVLSDFKGASVRTYKELLQPLEKVLRKVNYRGCVHVHALIDGDQFCVKEIIPDFVHPLSFLLYENSSMSASSVILNVLNETAKPVSYMDRWVSILKISLPPYPSQPESKEIEIQGISDGNLKHMWLVQASKREGRYYAQGQGLFCYITARGRHQTENPEYAEYSECLRRMYRTASNLKSPDLQYRDDIGKRANKLIEALRAPGWLEK